MAGETGLGLVQIQAVLWLTLCGGGVAFAVFLLGFTIILLAGLVLCHIGRAFQKRLLTGSRLGSISAFPPASTPSTPNRFHMTHMKLDKPNAETVVIPARAKGHPSSVCTRCGLTNR